MKNEIKGNIQTIYLPARVDSSNADEFEKEAMSLIKNDTVKESVFDASEMTYISSAGLRVLMKLQKASETPLKIRNVSRDVFDIFDTTGFTTLLDVKKAYRTIDVTGMKIIGKGFFGTVYRIDPETIVKVYSVDDAIPIIENEIEMARKAFINGIPTAIAYDIVKVGKDYGSVFELLKAKTFNELVQEDETGLDELLDKYAELMKVVHNTHLSAGTFLSYREKYMGYLDYIRQDLTNAQYDRLKQLLNDMPEEDTVIHGDIQMKNVMMTAEGPMLIDMETLGLGSPLFEFSGLWVTYKSFSEDDPGNSMAFLGISLETDYKVIDGTIEKYFSFKNDKERSETLDKIQLLAVIRFLYLIESTDLKKDALGKIRIDRSKEHLNDLIDRVKDFNMTPLEAKA